MGWGRGKKGDAKEGNAITTTARTVVLVHLRACIYFSNVIHATVGVGIARATEHLLMRSKPPACRCLVTHTVRRHSYGSVAAAMVLAQSERAGIPNVLFDMLSSLLIDVTTGLEATHVGMRMGIEKSGCMSTTAS